MNNNWVEVGQYNEEKLKEQIHDYDKEVERKINEYNRKRKKNKFKLPKNFLRGE